MIFSQEKYFQIGRSTNFVNFHPKLTCVKGQKRGYFDYTDVTAKVNSFSMFFYKLIITLFVIVLGMPFHMALFRWILGTYSADVWFLPYKIL